MKNINVPITHEELKNSKPGFIVTGKHPNRRMRRANIENNTDPNSTKLAHSSMNNPKIYRKGKFNGNFSKSKK